MEQDSIGGGVHPGAAAIVHSGLVWIISYRTVGPGPRSPIGILESGVTIGWPPTPISWRVLANGYGMSAIGDFV